MAGREIASDPAVLVEGAHVVLGLVVLQPEVPLIVEAHGPHFGGVEQQRPSLQHSQSDSEELNSEQDRVNLLASSRTMKVLAPLTDSLDWSQRYSRGDVRFSVPYSRSGSNQRSIIRVKGGQHGS